MSAAPVPNGPSRVAHQRVDPPVVVEQEDERNRDDGYRRPHREAEPQEVDGPQVAGIRRVGRGGGEPPSQARRRDPAASGDGFCGGCDPVLPALHRWSLPG